MASCCTADKVDERQTVRMGQIVVARKPVCLVSILGSCVGVALYHGRLKRAALGHVVLPDSSGREATPGKFADRAIPHMIRQLEQLGVNRAGLVAKIAGGACMFGGSGPLQIGNANIQAVTQVLAQAGIKITGKDVGGNKGRRVILNCETGEFVVQIAGKPTCTL